MEAVLSFTLFVLLCGYIAGVEGFTVTPAQEFYVINQWESAKPYFYVNPWPPPCPPCKPLNPALKKYEVVDVHFYNDTGDPGAELCHARWNNGTFDDTTGKCREHNSRVQDFNPHTSGGVLLAIENCTIYDQGQISVVIKYGEPDVPSSTQLKVHFAPPAPNITLEPGQTIQENTPVTLTCKVLSSNPLATLVWERKEHGSVVIPPNYYHNGTSWDDYTISTIEFSASHRDHGITYECRASNYIGHVSSGVALTVLHKPYASVKNCHDSPYYVEESKTATFTCEILAYPDSNLLVYWYNDTAEISTSNVTSYTIEDVRRHQAGMYACAAQNSEGKGERSNCTVDVQYPPGGPPFDDKVLREGESITVVCDADANPDVILYTWRRASDSDFVVENKTLSLRNINISDADTYTCLASNILTPTGSAQKHFTTPFPMNVFVIFSPRWKQYALNKFTAYLNQRTTSPATLICDAEGYPEVSYEWRFNGGTNPNWVITEVAGKSHLEIATPTSADLGAYLCTARNTENSVEFNLHLLEPGIPDEPQHCDVEQSAANEVTFRCVAGYAGGAQLGSYVEAEADGRKRTTIPSHTECVDSNSDTNCTLLAIRTRDLYPSTLYTFFLYGENTHGKSQKSFSIQAETKAGDPPPVNPDPGSNIGAMIGATIGAICGLALIIALAAYAFWRYNPKIKDDVNQPLTNDYEEIGRRYAGTRPLSASTLSLHGTDNPAYDLTRGPEGHDPYVNGSAPAQSRSRRSSGENISQQNYANHAYEMRGRQTNLAGMGALSHRSKQNLAVTDRGAAGTLRRPPSMPQLREEEEAGGGGGRGGGGGDIWEFPRDKLYLREKIGEGAFGEVWKAAAEGITRTPGMTTVAIKMVTGNAPDEQKQVLLKELDNMKLLKPHQNVVELYGCVTVDDPVYIIMEYIPMGNLHQFLLAGRTPHESARRLSMRDLLTFCSQVATGMDYVSSQGLLHRDLAARNVLLDEKLKCKVCDFGMARDIVTSRQYESKTQRRLPIRWMAPESLFDNIYSTKSDIWSFGVLVWEVITLGSSPYPGMSGPEVMEMIQAGKRMPRPAHCSDVLYTLMRDCWRRQPSDRPTFHLLRQKLNAMVKELEALPKTNFFVTEMEDNIYDCIVDLPGEKC